MAIQVQQVQRQSRQTGSGPVPMDLSPLQAAIAALHADAPSVEETDWVQIVEWYDELLRFADTPVVRLNRAVAVGEADGAPAGLTALTEVPDGVPRRDAVAAHLHERNGDLELAARLYGTNNINNCSYFCHQASGIALRSITGTSTATMVVLLPSGR